MPDVPNLDLSQQALQRYLSDVPADTRRATPEPSGKGLHLAWWASIIAAQMADGLTTNAAIGRGGREANPVMRGLAEHPTAMLLSKLGMGAGLAGVAHLIHKRRPTAGKVVAGIATGVPAAAAVSNSRVQ